MNRDFYHSYVTEKIELLSYRIKSNGKLNILNLNIHAEFFYRDLINLLFDKQFENANIFDQNSEAIDLIDQVNKTIIQVSSTDTTAKINKTLSKDILQEYKKQGYQLKFLFFSDADHLRKKKYTNTHKISFDPNKDIIDKISLMKSVLEASIDKQKEVYELVSAELGEKPDPSKISSNLTELIKLLSKEDLKTTQEQTKLNEYNIDMKIEFNDLLKVKNIIKKYKVYYSKLNSLYAEFDRQGNNKSLSVFEKLSRFYTEELLFDEYNNNQKFLRIINRTVSYIRETDNFFDLADEELELCVSIIIVDAFIKCKVFEDPEGYIHVTA
ncbi:SMEK domain-containing protein [Cohnella sp. LGH]|uniref:ABC-three component system protein n=1 Tax=Cohnella sp. LGH TaxID=1619153 RepID=UPI001ADA25D1|nr:ABC-three component system protein [Cohnella sp. LGH]QTH41656.1 SMEK domain-containing protein [Cohnella sp. LGH]